jgi:hypothetical protein
MPRSPPARRLHFLRCMKFRISTPNSLLDLCINLAIALLLTLVLWHVISAVGASLDLAWFASSDETVVVAEVIRFSNFDFHQSFFDMPGTPLMLFGAAEWHLFYTFVSWFHGTGAEANQFTFEHLDQLYRMIRVDNLVFFAISGLLLFRIVSRAVNRFAGAAAAILLLMSSPYEGTVTWIRVEPMSMCFMLAAIVALTEFPSWPASCLAGMLCGFGAACRLHSITASLPLLVLLLIQRNWKSPETYSRNFARATGALAALAFSGALFFFGLFTFLYPRWMDPFPHARALLGNASLAAAALITALVLAYSFRGTRPLVQKIVSPEMILMLVGVALGLTLGIPTAFIRPDAFMQSLNFYSSGVYADPVALHLPFLEKVTSFFTFYLKVILADQATLILFVAGAALILISSRWRALAPYLIVAAGFFLSKPLVMLRAPHHAALWIPFYAIVCSVPFGALGKLMETDRALTRIFASAAAIAALLWLTWELPDSPTNLKATMAGHVERTRNVAAADQWMSSHAGNETTVLVGFYCFDAEIFYGWFRGMDLFPPRVADLGPRQERWWGSPSALKGRSGLTCLGAADMPVLKQQELRQAGEGLEPLRDPRFQMVRSFGQGDSQVDVLRFDFR